MAARIFLDLNYSAVFIAGFIYFLLGFVWYSPRQFGQTWMRLNFMKNDGNIKHNKIISMALSSTFLASLTLAFFLKVTGANTITAALGIASIAAVALTASTIGMSFMFVGRELKLYLTDTAYHLTGFMTMGAILTLWM